MANMNTPPDRARVRLPGISSRAYEHPADRSALVAMRKLTGFDVLLRRLASLFSDRSLRLLFLASSVRASQEQFPQLHELLLDGSAVLEVEDEGGEIPSGQREQLFERFYRLDGTRASGSGLGLAIAKELAELMDGRITVESEPGRTVFALVLPAGEGISRPQREFETVSP